MARIEIYTTPFCPYCRAAKSLLARKGAAFSEIDVSGSPELRTLMAGRAGGRRSVPQVFIDERHIGGYEDLYALDEHGRLDPLLGRTR
jgi:glutaredoxin 3